MRVISASGLLSAAGEEPLQERALGEHRLREVRRVFQPVGGGGYAGPCMIEPFEPARTRFAAMSAKEAVDAAGAVFRKLDLL